MGGEDQMARLPQEYPCSSPAWQLPHIQGGPVGATALHVRPLARGGEHLTLIWVYQCPAP